MQNTRYGSYQGCLPRQLCARSSAHVCFHPNIGGAATVGFRQPLKATGSFFCCQAVMSPVLFTSEEARLLVNLGHASLFMVGCSSFRESSASGNARVCGSGKETVIWSCRHSKPAACILGLTGASMQLSLLCGFP